MKYTATVVGAGLAGCEAAWQLANREIEVTLCEMKPVKRSPAHHNDLFAELVCSNSLKAMRVESAAGLLKEEMRRMGSLIVPCAEQCSVQAGGALAVDRERFSALVTEKIRSHPNIKISVGEVTEIPKSPAIIATGPLTSDALFAALSKRLGIEYCSFYDAAAPIVTAESIDMEKAFFAARYGRGDAAYINCPMEREEYERFYEALCAAEAVELKAFEKHAFKVYEGCMPVEVMAKRGTNTLRFGPLKPVGIRHPVTNKPYYAVVQLRRENEAGTMYNLVGFQTNLRFSEQKRVFSLIPGLENAEFVRYGVMHCNTFLDSPRLLDVCQHLKNDPQLYFAGQITGVEGYIESAMSGILAGRNLANQLQGRDELVLPKVTMSGALMAYISDENVTDFQPMGCNMGLLPPLAELVRSKNDRYAALAARALAELDNALESDKE